MTSTAVDILFFKEGGLKFGKHKTIKEGSFKSYITAFFATLVLVISPKIAMFSWIVAILRSRSLLFFIPLMLITLIVRICRDGNIGVRKKLKRAALLTFFDIFGISKNILTSAITLFLSSILAIIVLNCTLPRSYNAKSLTFNNSTNTFYQSNPDVAEETCICQKFPFGENDWLEQYFKNNTVCMRERIINGSITVTPNGTTSANCYDEIFFHVPLYFSILATDEFPAITTCFTYDSILNSPMKSKENVEQHRFDKQCISNSTEIILPCSDELVFRTTIGLSVMIAWMCFTVPMFIFNKQLGKLLTKDESWYIICFLIVPGFLGGIGYVIYYLIDMLNSDANFKIVYEDGLSRTTTKIQLEQKGNESCQRINEMIADHLIQGETNYLRTVISVIQGESHMSNMDTSTPTISYIPQYYFCTNECAGVCLLEDGTSTCQVENYTADWYYHSYETVVKIFGISMAVIIILLVCFSCLSCYFSWNFKFGCGSYGLLLICTTLGIFSLTILGIYCITQDIENLKQRIEMETKGIQHFQNFGYDITNKKQAIGFEHINCTSEDNLTDAYITSFGLDWKIFGVSILIVTAMLIARCCFGYWVKYDNEQEIRKYFGYWWIFVVVFEFLALLGFGIYSIADYNRLSYEQIGQV